MVNSVKNKIKEKTNMPVTILLAIGALTILFPLYITIVVAFKSPDQMTTDVAGLLSLPTSWNLNNFREAIATTNFPVVLLNSLLITGFSVVLVIITNSLVAYAIARNMHKRFYKFAYMYFISGMFVPFAILMLPLVKQTSILNMDNIPGIIILYVVFNMSMNTLLYVGYLKNIPIALEEAAYVDGAITWTVFWKIIFPLLKPMHATVAIMTALATWNDVMMPLVILEGSDASSMTLPMAQLLFQTKFGTNYNVAFASYLLALLPILIFYVFAQKWIINGVTNGAVK